MKYKIHIDTPCGLLFRDLNPVALNDHPVTINQGSHRFHVSDDVGDLECWILDHFATGEKKKLDGGISCYFGIANWGKGPIIKTNPSQINECCLERELHHSLVHCLDFTVACSNPKESEYFPSLTMKFQGIQGVLLDICQDSTYRHIRRSDS